MQYWHDENLWLMIIEESFICPLRSTDQHTMFEENFVL